MVMVAIEYGWGVFWFEVVTVFLGVALIRQNQELTMRGLFQQTAGHVRPNVGLTLLKSARVTVGGILLILPGFITDGLGVALLILPGLHSFLLGLLKFPAPRSPQDPPKPDPSGRIIVGEFERTQNDSDKR